MADDTEQQQAEGPANAPAEPETAEARAEREAAANAAANHPVGTEPYEEMSAEERARRDAIAGRVLPENATPEQRERMEAEMERRHQLAARLQEEASQSGAQPGSFQAQMLLLKASKAMESGMPEPFRRGRWGSFVNFECIYENCADATLDERKAWLHFIGKHQQAEQTAARVAAFAPRSNPFIQRRDAEQ